MERLGRASDIIHVVCKSLHYSGKLSKHEVKLVLQGLASDWGQIDAGDMLIDRQICYLCHDCGEKMVVQQSVGTCINCGSGRLRRAKPSG